MNSNLPQGVTFILVKDNQFLIEKRALDKNDAPGMLSFPGGRVETDEEIQQTFMREIKEELNLVPLEYKFLQNVTILNKGKPRIINYFLVTKWLGDMQKLEADELIWIDYQKGMQVLNENADKEMLIVANRIVNFG